MIRYCNLLAVILFFGFSSLLQAQSPTPGLIVVPVSASGQAVLDNNNDGYVSADANGFVANDVGESEIPFKLIPGIQPEPTSDLATGPSCGFTDLVNAGSDFGVFWHFDGTNLLFGFRLGNLASNAKGYSILVDSDGALAAQGPLLIATPCRATPALSLR